MLAYIVQLQNNKMWEWRRVFHAFDDLCKAMGVFAISLHLFPLQTWEKEGRKEGAMVNPCNVIG